MEKLKDLTDFLTIIISRQEIEANDISQTLGTLNRLLEDNDTTEYFFERVDIGISGYDGDPRELWDIPEVNHFIHQLDNHFPYWFYFLTKFGSGLKVIAFCCINMIKLSNTKVWLEPATMEEFLNRHFAALNEIGERIGMPNKQNKEVTEMIIGYFS